MRRRVIGLVVLLAILALPALSAAQRFTDAGTGSQIGFTCTGSNQIALPANTKRRSFSLRADLANTTNVYVGFNSGILTTNGTPLAAGDALSDDTYYGDVWCVTSGSQILRILETAR